jgi:FkbM family methyltransferase
MILFFNKFIGMLLQLFPKYVHIKLLNMKAKFFVPVNNHYVSKDLINLSKGYREPKLYDWLNSIDSNSVFFDVGTNYGQEVTLASSMLEKNIRVVGFDCSLQASHICALNKKINDDNFQLVFAAVSDKSGELINISTSSDIHIKSLFKRVIHYNYDVISLSLDDFSQKQNLAPTHLKIDVDGAESKVLKGSTQILKSKTLKEIYIEIPESQIHLIKYIESFGFKVKWERTEGKFKEMIFLKSLQ